jgi:hypothetical protein
LYRLSDAGRRIAAAAVVLMSFWCLAAWWLAAPARADDTPERTTIVVFGDSQAAGLARGLQRVLVEDPHYRVINRTHAGAALVHDEREWLQPVERFTANEKADIAVVMLGANDRLDLRSEHGGYVHFGDDDWQQAYAARADKILALLTAGKMRVIWCGNPIARSADYSDDMSYINDIFAEETVRYGGQFVSLWTVVADEQGHYAAYGKDRGGVTTRMRADDGIHFTAAGYEMIAEKIVGLLSTSASATNPPATNAQTTNAQTTHAVK